MQLYYLQYVASMCRRLGDLRVGKYGFGDKSRGDKPGLIISSWHFISSTVGSDGEARTERTKRYLFAVAQLSVILTPQPARQVIILMKTRTHARTHAHTHMNTREQLCLWHFAVWQQQLQARLSSTVNTRHAAHNSCWVTQALSDTCQQKMTNVLRRICYPVGRLWRLISCTAIEPVNVGILTIFFHSSIQPNAKESEAWSWTQYSMVI